MKITRMFCVLAGLLMVLCGTALAGRGGRAIDTPGIPLYVIIEVTWDGISDSGTWTVWGPEWAPEVGTGDIISACSNCLDMTFYEFTFHGKTVEFDEVYVDTVTATPQVRHVVLHDFDGDGTYTGSLTSQHYFPWGADNPAILYMDRIDYEITFDEDGNVESFRYLQYEHKKMPQEE